MIEQQNLGTSPLDLMKKDLIELNRNCIINTMKYNRYVGLNISANNIEIKTSLIAFFMYIDVHIYNDLKNTKLKEYQMLKKQVYSDDINRLLNALKYIQNYCREKNFLKMDYIEDKEELDYKKIIRNRGR
jgi:hypothetical protein